MRQCDTPTANTTPSFIAHKASRYRTIRCRRNSVRAADICPAQRLATMISPDNHSAIAAQRPEPLGYRTTLGHRSTIRFNPAPIRPTPPSATPKGNNQGPFVFTENRIETNTAHDHNPPAHTARQPYARNSFHRPSKKAPQGTTA